MNKLIFSVLLVSLCASSFAVTRSNRPPMTPEQRAKLIAARQRQTGGFLQIKGHGFLAVLNGQPEVKDETIREIVQPIADFSYGVKVEVKPAKFALATAKAEREKAGAGACVFVADDPALPMSLVALEECWGMVNLAPLKAGAPDAAKFASRFRKELIRITSVVFSGAKSQYKTSPLQCVTSAEALDKTIGDAYGIDSLMNIVKNLPDFGIQPDKRITYMAACQQGIAPAPTNDVQKAIWDKVHAMPSSPIKIKPETKKVND